jgi:hypothetical protein
MRYLHYLVLTRCNSRLIANNSLKGLCDVVDEHVGLEVMVKQMIRKM